MSVHWTAFSWLGVWIAAFPAWGQDTPSEFDTAWISSVRWVDEQTLVAANSQGLLLRPGKALRVTVGKASNGGGHQWETIGESETSLWSILPVDGGVLASDYKGRVFRFASEQSQLQLDARWIRKLTPVPDSLVQVLAGTEDGKLIELSTDSNAEVRRIELGPSAIFDIAFSPHRDHLAVACGDGSIHLVRWPEMEVSRTIQGHQQAVWSVLFVSDGSQLLSGGADRKVRLWDVSKGQPVVAIASGPDWITSMVALPNSKLVAAGCMDGKILIVDYEHMVPVQTVPAASSAIWSMDLSPSGQRLALATRMNGLIVLEDMAEWHDAAQSTAAIAAANQPPQPGDAH